MIGQLLKHITDFFQNLFSVVLDFISNLFGYLFQKLFDLLKLLFNPIFILIAMIFYFIGKIATLVVLLFKVLLGIGKIFVSLVKGIFITLAGFNYTPTVRNDGKWTSIFGHISEGFGFFQLDNLAYVLMFLLWFSTGFAAIKILSSMGSGGDS
jgi:hypothetical protein